MRESLDDGAEDIIVGYMFYVEKELNCNVFEDYPLMKLYEQVVELDKFFIAQKKASEK